MTPALDFKNPNNACLSLRIIAEHVRRSEGKVIISETKDGITTIKVQWPQERPR